MLKGEGSSYSLDWQVVFRNTSLSVGVKNTLAVLMLYRRATLNLDPDVAVAFTRRSNLMTCTQRNS